MFSRLFNGRSGSKPRTTRRLRVESLEDRQLLSVSVAVTPTGTLNITGDKYDNKITITSNNTYVTVSTETSQGGLGETSEDLIPKSKVKMLYVNAGAGNDRIDASGFKLWLSASSAYAKAVLNGGNGADVIKGGAGDDTINGDDYLDSKGGAGDTLYGNGGNDRIDGLWGKDYLYGGDGGDRLYGGDVGDFLYGNDGDDFLHGEGGDDYLAGNNGADAIYGEAGKDTLVGDAFRDTLYGGGDNDTLQVYVDFDNLDLSRWKLLSTADYANAANGVDTLKLSLDLNSFGADFLQPAAKKVQSALKAFEPVYDALHQGVPVVSEYNSSLTFGYFLERGTGSSGLTKFIDAYEDIRDLSTSISSLTGTIDFGTFKLTSGKSNFSSVISTVASNPSAKISSSLLNSLKNLGVKFPLLSSPSSMVQLLVGQNVPLMEYTTPKFAASYSFTAYKDYYPTGAPGVFVKVEFGGKIEMSGQMTVGLDSSGIWTNKITTDGFYISNATASIKTSLTADGSVAIGVPNWMDFDACGATGEVYGTLTFKLKDPNRDGKLRANEVSSIAAAFTTTGTIGYELECWATYVDYTRIWEGLHRKTWEIAADSFEV